MASRSTRFRLLLAGAAVVAIALLVIGSFQVWLSVATDTGGRTQVAGWGAITGDSQLAGANINDLTEDGGSYRPGLIPVLIAGLALLATIGLVVPSRSRRPYRIPAAVSVLLGILAVGFAALRWFSPDPLAILSAGEAAASFGQGFTLLAGILLVGVGLAVLLGALDAPAPVPRRGIQG